MCRYRGGTDIDSMTNYNEGERNGEFKDGVKVSDIGDKVTAGPSS